MRCYLLALTLVFASMPFHRPSAAPKLQIQEMLTTNGGADLGKAETVMSLLDDGHEDVVKRVRGPSGPSMTWHVFFLADQHFLVPISRRGDTVAQYNFMFDGRVDGDGCAVKDVRLFRKLVDGKVVGFYAVQTTVIHGLPSPSLLHEVFRFERNEGDTIWDHPQFLEVAEMRDPLRHCTAETRLAKLIKLISDN
jgi:hypothetical protein